MSPDDAATIRRAYEVWNELGPAAVIEQFWAEDGVYREGPGWPDAGVYEGRQAALERMQSLVDLVGPIEVRLDDLVELPDGRLVGRVEPRGHASPLRLLRPRGRVGHDPCLRARHGRLSRS